MSNKYRSFNRDRRFGLVFNESEWAVLVEMAEAEGISIAALVRRLVRYAAKDKGLWPPKKAGEG